MMKPIGGSRSDRQANNRRRPQGRPQGGGGIQARGRRQNIGRTEWSRRFIATLESFADFSVGGRLARGAMYARAGHVLELVVRPGVVTARVQGSEPLPYQVRIATRVLEDNEWERVEEALASRAGFLAGLLAGKIPPAVEEAFESCGLSLFPASPDELQIECSCPDPHKPCKHIAATCYILADQFDADPFLLFAWRGRNREELLDRLGSLRSGFIAGPAAPPLARRVGDFWRAGRALASVEDIRVRAAEAPEAVLRALGPLEVDGEDLADLLAPAYRALAEGAQRLAGLAEGRGPGRDGARDDRGGEHRRHGPRRRGHGGRVHRPQG